jgi:hypothetical protein
MSGVPFCLGSFGAIRLYFILAQRDSLEVAGVETLMAQVLPIAMGFGRRSFQGEPFLGSLIQDSGTPGVVNDEEPAPIDLSAQYIRTRMLHPHRSVVTTFPQKRRFDDEEGYVPRDDKRFLFHAQGRFHSEKPV